MKPTHIILLLFVLFIAERSFSQNSPKTSGCEILRNGKFVYINDDDRTTYIEMNGDHQTERSEKYHYVIESTVKWIDDCNYVLTMTKISMPNAVFGPGDKMKVEITRVEGDIVYYTSNVKGFIRSG